MRRFVSVPLLLILIVLIGCGGNGSQAIKAPDRQVAEKPVDFPLTGVIDSILKGSSIQVNIAREDGRKIQFEIVNDAKVFFNSKPSSTDALTKGQTIYAESIDGTNISMVIIKNWPGFDRPGQAVKFSTQRAFEFALEFIRKNHDKLGLPDTGTWIQSGNDTKIGTDSLKRVMSWSVFRIRLIWIPNDEELNYDVILYRVGQETSIWSGSVLKDSSVREDRYENP